MLHKLLQEIAKTSISRGKTLGFVKDQQYLTTAKKVLNISFTRSLHSRSNITTHDLYLATVSKITTLLPNDGLWISPNPLKVPTIKLKISCKKFQAISKINEAEVK